MEGLQGVSKTFMALLYKAHRAVIFAIAQLFCNTIVACDGQTDGHWAVHLPAFALYVRQANCEGVSKQCICIGCIARQPICYGAVSVRLSITRYYRSVPLRNSKACPHYARIRAYPRRHERIRAQCVNLLLVCQCHLQNTPLQQNQRQHT